MPSDRISPPILEHIAHAVGLLLFASFFGTVFSDLEAGLPSGIYFAKSFTLSLVKQVPLALVLALVSVSFVIWLVLPTSRHRLTWHGIDCIGGLRWPIFAMGATLAWNYAGHPYNYYFDQSHCWDRWLLILLLLGMLRSPLLIPVFALELLVSRAQFSHPINAITTIGDELPIRVLGMVAGCALWNGLLGGLESVRAGKRFTFLNERRLPPLIRTDSLVYSILCLIASYYAFAGLAKLLLGASLTDWMRFSHMENLFVASYLNGWLNHLPEARILEVADSIRSISVPISVVTVLVEMSMALILLRQRGTALLLGAISSLHIGIVFMTGIIFWKWVVVDVSILVWLWLRRNDDEIRRMYTGWRFVASLPLMAVIMLVSHGNYFTWWNTKWIKVYEFEARDDAGNVYLVDYADFSPYVLFDIYQRRAPLVETYIYGGSLNQQLMRRLEELDRAGLAHLLSSAAESGEGPAQEREKRTIGAFMKRYFKHRNNRPARGVSAFALPPPAMHNRHLSAPNLYRDQAPIVGLQLRFIEFFYSGSELHQMRNEIVHTIEIPPDDG